jgi:hypothetical protein
MDMNALVAQAKSSTAALENQTEARGGGDFEHEVPPAGFTPARFIGYIELGKRKQRPYQGKEKPDAEEVRLEFELNGPKHQRKVVVDGVEQTFTNRIAIKITKKITDRGSFFKLMTKMLYGRESITHMAQLLGEGFLIQIRHEEGEKDGKKRIYASMRDTDGNFMIGAPVVVDPLSNESRPVPVPEPTQAVKLLLWHAPTMEQWNSLFIDGSRTFKDEKGVERTVSKNWLQEDIVQNALNYEGSALQALLGGVGSLDLDPTPSATASEPATTVATAAAATTPAATVAAATAAPPAAAAGADDLMASLGFK